MIIIVLGPTHSGKTAYCQKIMEKYKISYISQDHIKMGLIRSGYTSLTNDSPDSDLINLLWPITKEIINTAIENRQNLIIEGCYIPFTWKNDFDNNYLKEIKCICLCFSERYIKENYSLIMKYEDCIEKRIDSSYCTMELLIRENKRFRDGFELNDLPYVLIDDNYEQTIESISIDELK